MSRPAGAASDPASHPALCVLGLMSGTSMDGIDAAFLTTDGTALLGRGESRFVPFSNELRAQIEAAVKAAIAWNGNGEFPQAVREAERAFTLATASAVKALIAEANRAPDLIGFHGQTVLHRPDAGLTVQIGDGALLAQLTDCPVVNEFRVADMAAGGQGAPFAPAYHAAALAQSGIAPPAAVLNLGGVANITYWDGEQLLAFDTGPANGPLDQWIEAGTGAPMDKGGSISAAGQVHSNVLASLLDHPYFDLAPPKSLDRFDFDAQGVRGLSLEDGAATLVAFSAQSLALAFRHLPRLPNRAIACGGGRHNPALMAALREALPCPVVTAESQGWRGDFIEAEAFAFLAARSRAGLPLSFPGTTGVPAPQTGGVFHEP
ncbi:MAG: anhydro-N-acetylmuramic acid kinase, partial [Pseudomonadota bacterium]